MAMELPTTTHPTHLARTMRIALGLEYTGTHFCGWQTQPHAPSIQHHVETALSKVANHPITVTCAGRTDTGVHATAQVIHTDVTAPRTMRSWILGTNANLSTEISILWAQPVDENFHARFTAQARHYRYLILNRPTRPAILAKRVTWERKPLDIEPMQAAAKQLIGTHDFTSYRATACQAKSPIRTITHLTIARTNQQITIDIAANAFLHHMVRNIAGVLMTIGRGEQQPKWAKTVLEARNRTAGGITAPPDGLYLYQIDYPEPYNFPKPPPPF